MLTDCSNDEFEVIVVHKMDRFSRSMKIALQAFEFMGSHNIGLVSINEPHLDYATAQGKLFMHMLWALSQFYSDNLAQEVKKGKDERRAQGLYNGLLPYGVMKAESGVPVADTRDLGATSTASKRMKHLASPGLRASQASAAAMMRARCRGVTDQAAASSVSRAFTSTNARVRKRRAMMSTSPEDERQRRATMR